MKSITWAIAIVAIVVLAGAGAVLMTGHGGDDVQDGTDHVTDSAGRSVPIPESLDGGIVVVGMSTSPLRLLSMFDVHDHVIEVDMNEVNNPLNGRGYAFAFDYTDCDYHANNTLDNETVESIASKNPSLVVVMNTVYTTYRDNVEILSNAAPTFVLKVQVDLWDEDVSGISDEMSGTIDTLGKLLGQEERAEELISGIDGIIKDIRSLVGESDLRAYLAGANYGGTNTLNTTLARYNPFTLTGLHNAYTGGETSKVEIPVERLTRMDFDIMVLDPSSADKYGDPNSQLVMQYYHSINSDSDPDNDVRIYTAMPVSGFGTNYDGVLVNGYFLAHVFYGQLTGEQMLERIDNIYTVFYGDAGKDVFQKMGAAYQDYFGRLGYDMSLLAQVEIVDDGGRFEFRTV